MQIAVVYLHCNAYRILTQLVHCPMDSALRRDLFAAVHIIKKFCCCHNLFLRFQCMA